MGRLAGGPCYCELPLLYIGEKNSQIPKLTSGGIGFTITYYLDLLCPRRRRTSSSLFEYGATNAIDQNKLDVSAIWHHGHSNCKILGGFFNTSISIAQQMAHEGAIFHKCQRICFQYAYQYIHLCTMQSSTCIVDC